MLRLCCVVGLGKCESAGFGVPRVMDAPAKKLIGGRKVVAGNTTSIPNGWEKPQLTGEGRPTTFCTDDVNAEHSFARPIFDLNAG